ncbi:C39 family peptidase [Enterococcus sp.]|uniref:C39 family peptidase n=1 Tax=Enterococcus sp. TaxID=35783 RepID=UPI000EC591D5|nr:C39 family peptidase [Enterococcus sp.]HCE13300.1 hypothetical protein [Enterococcus sp.]
MEKSTWQGIPEERFRLYRQWVTPSGYLCGTYAAAVFLAYYQDHIDASIIPQAFRKKNQRDLTAVTAFLRLVIQPHGLPTISWQVAHGLSRYFAHFQLPYRGRATMVGGWQRACKRIDQGKPVIIGILKPLGSTYGNHWVVAYAYLENDKGERFFKVHDNWGNYRKVIPASWVNGTVTLP